MQLLFKKFILGFIILPVFVVVILFANTSYAMAAILDNITNTYSCSVLNTAPPTRLSNYSDGMTFVSFWIFQEYLALKPQQEQPTATDAMKSPYSAVNLPHEELNNRLLSQFDGYFNTSGMPVEIYDATMTAEWKIINN